MIELLKQKYTAISALKGKELYKFIGLVFGVFIVAGLLIGYATTSRLKESETFGFLFQSETDKMAGQQPQTQLQTTYKGIVTYLGEDAYAADKISYSLTDSDGNDIILLRAKDDKLNIVDGLFVSATGKVVKTSDLKNQVLEVTEVTLNNGSN